MAISDGTAEAWVATTTRNPTVTLPTHAAGDMLLVRMGWKSATPDTDVAVCNTSGWAKIGQFYDGQGASSNGGGGVLVAVFWKVATSSSETNPTIEFDDATAPTPGAYCAVTYQKGAADSWLTPVGDGGAFASSTSISATIQSHVTATAGDMIDAFSVVDDNNVMTVPTFTQSGLTLDTVTEYPATALNSGTSNDISADGCNRLVTDGTSSAAAVVTGSQNVADSGASWTTRLRVLAGATVPGSVTANAVIKKTGLTGSLSADAVKRQTFTVATTTAAAIKQQTYTVATTTVDAEITFGTQTITVETTKADAVLLKTITDATRTIDAIKRLNVSDSIVADAITRLVAEGSAKADAVLLQTILDATHTADAIKRLSSTEAIVADAIVQLIAEGSLTADAVRRASFDEQLFVDAIRRESMSGSLTADAITFKTIDGLSFAVQSLIDGGTLVVEDSFATDAYLSSVGRCVWTSPLDGDPIDPTPELKFLMPTSRAEMYFWIELDKADTFDTADLRRYMTTTDLTGWSYWDGNSWEAITSAGVSNTYAGNEARFAVTVPLAGGAWYRRVRAGTR